MLGSTTDSGDDALPVGGRRVESGGPGAVLYSGKQGVDADPTQLTGIEPPRTAIGEAIRCNPITDAPNRRFTEGVSHP